MANSSLPLLMWSIVAAIFASTAGSRYVTPVTSEPSRMRVVMAASAASALQPSKQLALMSCPGPGGTKWSNVHAL